SRCATGSCTDRAPATADGAAPAAPAGATPSSGASTNVTGRGTATGDDIDPVAAGSQAASQSGKAKKPDRDPRQRIIDSLEYHAGAERAPTRRTTRKKAQLTATLRLPDSEPPFIPAPTFRRTKEHRPNPPALGEMNRAVMRPVRIGQQGWERRGRAKLRGQNAKQKSYEAELQR